MDLIMQIRIADVERMNCKEEAKKKKHFLTSPPLYYYFVLDRNIYRKTNKENNLVKDVVAQSTSLMVGKLNVESFLERVEKKECI